MIERRGAILRHSLHTIEEQLSHEGINVTFKQLLAEAVFSGNSLITHGGATPYHARFGTQPTMLPDLHAFPQDTTAGTGRYVHRIREIALQRIIESTAVARINRALRTNTTISGETLNFQPNELVDFHRPPSRKDESGWHGPAKVIRNVPERGQVVVKWNGKEVFVRYPDARRFMEFSSLVFGVLVAPGTAANETSLIIQTFLANLPDRHMETFGYMKVKGEWRITATTKRHQRVAYALDYFVRQPSNTQVYLPFALDVA
jgi:hypothetical protein